MVASRNLRLCGLGASTALLTATLEEDGVPAASTYEVPR